MPKQTWKTSMKENMRRIKLVKQTQDHDRTICKCEGCKWYDVFGTIINNGIMYHVESNWKDISPEEWHRSFTRFTNYRNDKKLTIEKIKEELTKKGVPKNEIEKITKKLLFDMVPHVVFAQPSPQGIMREI